MRFRSISRRSTRRKCRAIRGSSTIPSTGRCSSDVGQCATKRSGRYLPVREECRLSARKRDRKTGRDLAPYPFFNQTTSYNNPERPTMKIRPEDALEYHSAAPAGKVSVTPTKPCLTQRDLSLAYTPGVAVPCLEIERDPSLAYKYTAKANLVAVISNGTAVLGLGDIGALAGKPVMEGKGVLFKRFADIDVFDIELNTHDADEIIKACQLLEPTFGGINLEDIKAPECFYIEETLKKTMKIPVFHDDQHGTAIISGAGAAGIGCARFYRDLGVALENMILCDSHGVIYAGRSTGMNRHKAEF